MSGQPAKSVLITGGAGFIGSRLAARFHREGYDVVVLDNLLPQVHGSDPHRDSPGVRSLIGVARLVEGTVTSEDDLRRTLDGVDIVVHLAAETGTGQSMYEIDRYVSVNVGGTAKLLDVLANTPHHVQRIVVASSRSVYGEGAYRTIDGRTVYPPQRDEKDLAAGRFEVGAEGEGRLEVIPTSEDAALHPSSVYGITKQMQESLVMTVAPTIGAEPVSLRYQNVYGPGQSLTNPYTGILSIFATLIRRGKGIQVFEDGLESRDFVFVDDIVDATYLAATHPAAGHNVFNVGSGQPTTVLEVVEQLSDALGMRVPMSVTGEYRVGDIRHNFADMSRIRERLGFAPRVDFAEGVRAFARWVADEPIGEVGFERSLEEMSSRRLLRTSYTSG